MRRALNLPKLPKPIISIESFSGHWSVQSYGVRRTMRVSVCTGYNKGICAFVNVEWLWLILLMLCVATD